jgi:hypothetical protein
MFPQNEISRYLEATIGRQQKPYFGTSCASQEEKVAKVGESSLKAPGGTAARTGHLSYDQPFSVQRFGGAMAAASSGAGSSARQAEPSIARPSTMSAFPALNDPVGGVQPVLAVEQERLDSAIASILGDSVKDDDADFLGGLEESTALLDINVGDAASAVASLANLGIDSITPLESVTPSIPASTSDGGLSYPDPFMGVGGPSSSSAASSVSPVKTSASSFVPAPSVPTVPKDASKKRQRRSNG